MSTSSTGLCGELVVGNWLRTNGYQVSHNTKGPFGSDLIATSDNVSLLVQVKTTFAPGDPDSISDEERTRLCWGALVNSCRGSSWQAWVAKVVLGGRLGMGPQITWERVQ